MDMEFIRLPPKKYRHSYRANSLAKFNEISWIEAEPNVSSGEIPAIFLRENWGLSVVMASQGCLAHVGLAHPSAK